MEANKFITAFLFLNALSFGPIHLLAAQVQSNPKVQKSGSQDNAHKNTNDIQKTNTQWFADPERGWVRTDDPRLPPDQNKSEAKQAVGKEKTSSAKVSKHY